jgi:hypothetical protein
MGREPDVEMSFAVRAEELRFACKPHVDVAAFADSPATAESQSERENLPDEIEPGATYRNVAVRWRAAAWLGDPDWDEAVNDALRTRPLWRGAPPQQLLS